LIASVLVLEHFFLLTLWQAIGVTVVLLFHELGHVVGMKLGGTRVRGVLFLPFVGAATLAEHAFVSRWHEVWAQLAGPLMAFPTALVAALLWRTGVLPESTGSMVFWSSLLLNLLQLIPVLPLDGGRVLLSLTADFPRGARLPAVVVPILLMVALFLLVSAGPAAFVAAVVLAFSLFATRMALRRDAFYRWMIDERLPLGALRLGLRDVTWAFSGIAREDVDGGVPPTPMTAVQAAIGLLAYVALTVAIVAVAAVAFVYFGPAWRNA
jgi:Zn-dependent protease